MLLILRFYPRYKEKKEQKQLYVDPVPSNDHPDKAETKTNGDVPTSSDTEAPQPIEPYPSDFPLSDKAKKPSAPHSVDKMNEYPDSDNELKEIPEDLEMNEEGEDCDTLLKKEDMVKPKSYDPLPPKDSAV